MNEKIKELREQYAQAIIQLENKDDIDNLLPNIEYENAIDILSFIKERVVKEYNSTLEEYKNIQEKELKEMFEDRLNILKYTNDKIDERLLKAKIVVEVENSQSNDVTLIFARTSNGRNYYIDRDLKYVEEEYYSALLGCLTRLESGIKNNNPEKMKQMSGNKKLSQIREIKDFKVRVFYKKIESNVAYVYCVKMKKANNDTYDRSSVEERVTACRDDIDRVQKILKNPSSRKTLIAENMEIRDRIFEYLEQNRRR